ncbi:MAG: sigma-70 family RNA polymerase sigma factor [Ruminococcus bromii]|nr:sigma-70 family RNA polymerase sigma factor [Ruminococcus bromii]
MEFDQIYSTYFKSVYLYVMQLSGNEHIAEEITSETFFKAINSVDRFRGDCDMRVWLCQIAKNTYYSYLKKNKKELSIDESNLQNVADPDAYVDTQISEREEARLIRKILHDISDPYKEVFMWRVFGELSFKDIGDLYGKTDNWACVTYHRARKMIQSRLEEIEHEK